MNGYAATATYIITDDCITDQGSGWDVMSTWESPIMQKHADIVCANGGHILEFGFGMGISADMIQAKNPTSHTIIEINDAIYTRLEEWASDKSNVVIVKGDWYDDIPTDKKYDGIFYDGFGDMLNKRHFPSRIMQHCKVGTILTWYNNFLEEESQYSGEQKKHKGHTIEQFDSPERITYEQVSLTIPDKARIDWYLKGDGNTYYTPKLVVESSDL